MEKRIILVTGASRGIGRAAALDLAQSGAHVIGLARTQGGLEELNDEIVEQGGTCTMIPADLTDREAMARLPEALGARFGRIDGLLSNAGTLGELTPVSDIQEKLWDGAIELNVTATVRLLASLDGLLRASEAPRVVVVTSGRARKVVPYWSVYGASKAALEHVTLAYAAENDETAIRTNLIDPGPIATVMREKAMPGEDQSTLPSPAELAPVLTDLLSPEETRNGEIINFREMQKG